MKQEKIKEGRVLGYRAYQVLNVIRHSVEEIGYIKPYEEICAELGIGSKGEISRIMDSLERRGIIFRVGTGTNRRVVLIRNENR